nr:hypothetical protein [uncultured Odoribacter sp.]
MSLQLMIRYSDGDGGISSARGGGRWMGHVAGHHHGRICRFHWE